MLVLTVCIGATACGEEPVVFPPRDFICAAGETAPCETAVPLRDEAARTVVPGRELAGATLTYVVNQLSMPSRDMERRDPAVGFDLDGVAAGDGDPDGTSCQELFWDYPSDADPGHVGVDNMLQLLVTTAEAAIDEGGGCPEGVVGCLDAHLARVFAEGRSLILIEVGG